jgi:hypothetical protein
VPNFCGETAFDFGVRRWCPIYARNVTYMAQVVAVLSKTLENYSMSAKVVRMVLAFLTNVIDQPGSAGSEATRVLAICGTWKFRPTHGIREAVLLLYM